MSRRNKGQTAADVMATVDVVVVPRFWVEARAYHPTEVSSETGEVTHRMCALCAEIISRATPQHRRSCPLWKPAEA